jgi:hypothetical protein
LISVSCGHSYVGNLERPDLQTGGPSGLLPSFLGDKHIYRRVVERRVYPDGGFGTAYATRMTYSRPETSISNAGYVTTDQYNSAGILLNRSQHYLYGSARASFHQQPTEYGGWQDGREYQTTVFAANGTTRCDKLLTCLSSGRRSLGGRPILLWRRRTIPRLIETDTTLSDTNLVSKQTFDYDDSVPFNNQNNVKEYAFGTGAPGADDIIKQYRSGND